VDLKREGKEREGLLDLDVNGKRTMDPRINRAGERGIYAYSCG
jgi:hypothetical protein